jgi:hypothetical protein
LQSENGYPCEITGETSIWRQWAAHATPRILNVQSFRRQLLATGMDSMLIFRQNCYSPAGLGVRCVKSRPSERYHRDRVTPGDTVKMYSSKATSWANYQPQRSGITHSGAYSFLQSARFSSMFQLRVLNEHIHWKRTRHPGIRSVQLADTLADGL